MKTLKKPTLAALTLLLFFTLATVLAAGTPPSHAQNIDTNTPRTVSVIGNGVVQRAPDTAQIDFSIETEGKTAYEAQQNNADATNKMLNILQTLGIDRKDIKTSWYNIYPQYDYTDSTTSPKIISYKANNSITLKIRSLDKVSTIIDEITKNGATSIGGVNYLVENKSEALDQARELAAKDALQKAQKLGKVLNFTVGKVVTVSENSYDYTPVMYAESKGNGQVIAPTTLDVRLSLNISYEIL